MTAPRCTSSSPSPLLGTHVDSVLRVSRVQGCEERVLVEVRQRCEIVSVHLEARGWVLCWCCWCVEKSRGDLVHSAEIGWSSALPKRKRGTL